MNNILLTLVLLTFSFQITNAETKFRHVTKEKRGQSYYLQRCSDCHGNGSRGANIYSIAEWKTLFSNNAQELIELHEFEDNTKEILQYLKSDDFTKESAKMLKFIQEFAYDSELIPTCY